MPKSDNQKLKILYILDYLRQHSNESNLVKASELQHMLEKFSIQCDRKTIYSDVAALQDYGADIVSVPGKNGGYYIASGDFELPELKLLVDAVQSSRYLTEKKSRDLIKKLSGQCNVFDAAQLNRNVMVSGRVKNMNESIYYSVDTIQEAISQNRQITFRYFDWDLNRDDNRNHKRKYRNKEYCASPYGLYQDNENCYLLAHSEAHGVTHYRVDRMDKISLLDTIRTPCPELGSKEALQEYANKLFSMYAGDPVSVRLRFHRSLINVVVDRFGQDTQLTPDGEEYFNASVNVAVSPMFFSWVMQFGKNAKILTPDSVVSEFMQYCQEIMSQY